MKFAIFTILTVHLSGFNCIHNIVEPCLRCIITLLVSEALLWLQLVVFYSTLHQDNFVLNSKDIVILPRYYGKGEKLVV